ncbi:MAG: hypothetical protein IJV46_08495, partial [Acidaminococcaceae bacterium]|nr:hypothetical protein [Acidaminococcaceae bacterium]
LVPFSAALQPKIRNKRQIKLQMVIRFFMVHIRFCLFRMAGPRNAAAADKGASAMQMSFE